MLSYGYRVADFLASKVIQTKGQFAGQPLAVEPWQREFLDELYRVREDGSRVYQQATLLVPRKNGKTTLGAGIGLYELLADWEQSPEVYVAAGARDQATVLHRQAKDMVEASPTLADHLVPMQYHIACPDNNGIFRVLSSDAKLQHGSNPSCALIDEKWVHKSNDLASALTTGVGARIDPLVLTMSTVGHDLDSPLGQDFTRAMKLEIETRHNGFLTIARDEENGYLFWYYGPPTDEAGQPLVDLDDPAVWRACNPASWITDEFLRRQHANERLEDFRRFHLNAWIESEEFWLPPGSWKVLARDGLTLPDQAEVYAGVDIGLKRDRAAVTVVRPLDEHDEEGRRLYETDTAIFTPPEKGKLDIGEVTAYIRQLAAHFQILGIGYDPHFFEPEAQRLADEGLPMEEFPQVNERMCPASAELYDAITQGRVFHNGDAEFASHVAAGSTTETERGWRITKRKATKPIDALIALVMAFWLAHLDEGGSVYDDHDVLILD